MSEFKTMQKQMEGKKGQPSWYDRIRPDLSDEKQAALDDALSDRSIYHTTIAAVLDQWGFDVTRAQVAHYRRSHLGF